MTWQFRPQDVDRAEAGQFRPQDVDRAEAAKMANSSMSSLLRCVLSVCQVRVRMRGVCVCVLMRRIHMRYLEVSDTIWAVLSCRMRH
eukprot:1392612-Amorphochlora_amoeboformis.AAC.1